MGRVIFYLFIIYFFIWLGFVFEPNPTTGDL